MQRVVLQLGRKGLVGKVVLRHNQQARGILVDAVDNAGAQLAVDAGEAVPAVIEQGVDQRAVPVARRRMHHKPLWLVDDQHVLVLVGNIQRHGLGLQRHRLGLGRLKFIDGPGLRPVALAHGPALTGHGPGVQQLLRGAAADALSLLRQKDVQPDAAGLSSQLHGRPPAFSRCGQRTARRRSAPPRRR